MLRVWHVSLLEFRKFKHRNKYFTNGESISIGFIATAEQTGITRVVLTQHTTYYRGFEHFARFTSI